MQIENGSFSSFVDKVEDLNDKVRKSIGAQKQENNGILVSVDKITQKTPFIHLRIKECLSLQMLI